MCCCITSPLHLESAIIPRNAGNADSLMASTITSLISSPSLISFPVLFHSRATSIYPECLHSRRCVLLREMSRKKL